MVDSNNNSAGGKYSLRPRSEHKKSSEHCAEEDVTSLLACKVNTRKTSRQRSQPLSKYRRRSANARERSRMREINEAFETLRRMVSWGSDIQAEKTTKISTLRLAMGYITALSNALRTPGEDFADVFPEDPDTLRSSEHHRSECVHPSLEFKNVSIKSLLSHSVCGADSSSSMVKSKVFKRESVSSRGECKEPVFFNIQTNSENEIIRASSEGVLRDVSLAITDDYVNDQVSSIPKTIDNLVDEFNVKSTKEIVETSVISRDCSFYSIKKLETSLTDCCEENDKLTCEKTSFLEASLDRGSVLDSVQPEYDDSFLPVEEELGHIPISHISLEELFNS